MKKIFKVIITLILIQLLRIGFKELMFLFIEKTVFNNTIINSIYMMLLIIVMILVIKKKNLDDKKLCAYIFSSMLFGIWHFGYIDTVIFRTSIFNPNANIMIIMINKVITGIVLGCIFGILKYKTKNAYSSMMLHTLINTIES